MFRRTAAVALFAASTTHATEFNFATPSHDRWHYPFNSLPGGRPTASCFGTAGDVDFNDRDAYVILSWDTSVMIPPGLGAAAYDITSLRVTVTNQANASIHPQWPIDLTTDEWFTYDIDGDGQVNADGIPRGQPGDLDGESSDPDAGRPIELFGAGFGPAYTPASWTESSAYIGSAPGTVSPRDPFPFVYQTATQQLLHVEDNVDGLHNGALGVFEFTPLPWAVGQPVSYTPGAQSVPFDVEFDIDLSASNGAVRQYFQQQLNDGRIYVVVTSLRETTMQGASSGFPSFYMKEGVALDPGAKAASLRVTLTDSAVPAVSDWGLIALAIILLTVGTLMVRRGANSGRVL